MKWAFIIFTVIVFAIGYNAGSSRVDEAPPKFIKTPVYKTKTETKVVYKDAELPQSCVRALDAAKEMWRNASTSYNSLARTEAELKGARQDVVLAVSIASRLESMRDIEGENTEALMALNVADYDYVKNRTECEEALK